MKHGLFTLCCLGMTLAEIVQWPSQDRVMTRADEPPMPFELVPPDKWTGEPYELSGNRLAFTDWYYVHKGRFCWQDAQGQGVTATQHAIGPWGARFLRLDDMPRGVRLIVERPNRIGPVIVPERPWEEMGLSVNILLKDGEKYRAWGNGQDKDGKNYGCYFESTDGLSWTRPDLGFFEYGGNSRNNLIAGVPGCIFIDPTAPPAERYKGVSTGEISAEELKAFAQKHPDHWEHRSMRDDVKFILAVFGFVSADGLRWNRLAEPFAVEHSDTQISAGYDPTRKKYMYFTRNYYVGPRSPRADGDPLHISWIESGRRAVGFAESDRFCDFPLSRVVLTPRPDMSPSQLLYTNCFTTFPGAPDRQLMFPAVWDVNDDATHLEMAVGFQGAVWNWLGGKLMETGTFGEFDGGAIFWHPNLTELPNGDFVLPYTGYAFPHKYPRGAWSYRPGYAVWPRGRLTAIEAPETGEFTTVSFMPPRGRKLRINAVTKRAGSVLVALCQPDGQYLPGRSFDDALPIIGDRYRELVRWTSGDELPVKAGEPIRLRLRLDRAKVYFFEFEN